jgi:hypothetical protein
VLDYAAALWNETPSAKDILSALQADAQKRALPPPLPRIAKFIGTDDSGARDHLESLAAALAGGRFTAIVLMDHVDDRLRTLVSFINENSDFRVLAVELEYYEHDGAKIVSPRVFGAEVRRASGASPHPRWDEGSFFRRLSERGALPETVAAVRQVYEFAQRQGSTGSGAGTDNPSFNPYLLRGVKIAPITIWTDGKVQLKLSWLRNDPIAGAFVATALDALERGGLPVDRSLEKDVIWPPDTWVPQVDTIIAAFAAALQSTHGV